jgi:hypothetical protein
MQTCHSSLLGIVGNDIVERVDSHRSGPQWPNYPPIVDVTSSAVLAAGSIRLRISAGRGRARSLRRVPSGCEARAAYVVHSQLLHNLFGATDGSVYGYGRMERLVHCDIGPTRPGTRLRMRFGISWSCCPTKVKPRTFDYGFRRAEDELRCVPSCVT